jgi:hypothetical protein
MTTSYAKVIEKSIPILWIPLRFQFYSKESEWNWNGVGIKGNRVEMMSKQRLNNFEQKQKSKATNSTETYNDSCTACLKL